MDQQNQNQLNQNDQIQQSQVLIHFENENEVGRNPQSQEITQNVSHYYLYLNKAQNPKTVLKLKKNISRNTIENLFLDLDRALNDFLTFISQNTNLINPKSKHSEMFIFKDQTNTFDVHVQLKQHLEYIEKAYKKIVDSDIFEPKLKSDEQYQVCNILDICDSIICHPNINKQITDSLHYSLTLLNRFNHFLKAIWIKIFNDQSNLLNVYCREACFIFYFCNFFFFRGYEEFKTENPSYIPLKLTEMVSDLAVFVKSQMRQHHNFSPYKNSPFDELRKFSRSFKAIERIQEGAYDKDCEDILYQGISQIIAEELEQEEEEKKNARKKQKLFDSKEMQFKKD